MATIQRVGVTWAGSGVTGTGISTFYFETAPGTPQQHVDAVSTFLAATEGLRASGLGWTINPDSAEIDTATGALVNIYNIAGASGSGTATGDRLPNATQGLARLITGAVAGGRLVRGRLFLPGVVESFSNGLPSAGYISGYNTPLAALVASANANWVVWSRKNAFTAAVTSATVWSNFAQLRSRRD